MTVRDMAKREKKRAIRCFVDEHIQAHHMSPSMSGIAEAIGINKTTAWRYLKEMDETGEVCYHGEDISTAVSVKVSAEQISILVAGVIPCGAPENQVQDIEAFYSFPRALVGEGEFFMLRASGDSMVDAGIDSGDLVVVRRESEARNGQIVAALTEDGRSTLKTLIKQDDDTAPYLHPENKAAGYSDIYDHFSIQGVAVKIIKDL